MLQQSKQDIRLLSKFESNAQAQHAAKMENVRRKKWMNNLHWQREGERECFGKAITELNITCELRFMAMK